MLNKREMNLVKEAIARTRYELGDRKAAPGAQDSHWAGEGRVVLEDAHVIRDYARERLNKK